MDNHSYQNIFFLLKHNIANSTNVHLKALSELESLSFEKLLFMNTANNIREPHFIQKWVIRYFLDWLFPTLLCVKKEHNYSPSVS